MPCFSSRSRVTAIKGIHFPALFPRIYSSSLTDKQEEFFEEGKNHLIDLKSDERLKNKMFVLT